MDFLSSQSYQWIFISCHIHQPPGFLIFSEQQWLLHNVTPLQIVLSSPKRPWHALTVTRSERPWLWGLSGVWDLFCRMMVPPGLHLRHRSEVHSPGMRKLSYSKSKQSWSSSRGHLIELCKLSSALNMYSIILPLPRWDKRIKQELLGRKKNKLIPQMLGESFSQKSTNAWNVPEGGRRAAQKSNQVGQGHDGRELDQGGRPLVCHSRLTLHLAPHVRRRALSAVASFNLHIYFVS